MEDAYLAGPTATKRVTSTYALLMSLEVDTIVLNPFIYYPTVDEILGFL